MCSVSWRVSGSCSLFSTSLWVGFGGAIPLPPAWLRRRVSKQLGPAPGTGAQGELSGGVSLKQKARLSSDVLWDLEIFRLGFKF